MVRYRLVAVFILSLGLLARGAYAQDAAKGAALLAEARNALGGDGRLASVTRLQANGTIRMGAGNANLEGDVELLVELPDKFKRKESLSLGVGGPGIDRTQILNGSEFKEETSGPVGGRGGFRGRGGFGGRAGGGQSGDVQAQQPQIDPERLREAQRRNAQAEMSRLMLAILLTTDAPVTWIGTAQSPDGTADVLEVRPEGGVPMRLLLDSATHMPLMLTWTGGGGGFAGLAGFAGRGRGRPGDEAGAAADGGGPPQGDRPPAADGRRGRGGQQATVQMHLAEYKTVNGIKLPHLITRGVNGETNEEWVVKSYRINPNFKADTFQK